MKRQIITIILALVALTAGAQTQREITITGDVKDGFMKTPLTDAKVAICRADSSVLADSLKMTIYMRSDKPFLAVYSAKVTTDANAVLVHAWKRATTTCGGG